MHRISVFLLSMPIWVLARAGGGGGSSSSGGSGGSGGGGGEVIFLVIRAMSFFISKTVFRGKVSPFTIEIILIVVFIVGANVYRIREVPSEHANRHKQRHHGKNTYERMSRFTEFMEENPDFSQAEFIQKCKTAFMEIQEAWSKQDLRKVRHFISDGVYQRFHTQFEVQKKTGQQNILSNIEILDVVISDSYLDGDYQTITVAFQARMKDIFSSKTFPHLDVEYNDTFWEYWSFTRKLSHTEKKVNYYDDNFCPNCSAPLGDLEGESANCPSCNTLLNNGFYDWVLAEITQEEFFGFHTFPKEFERLRAHFVEGFEDFSIQGIEDKASQAFFQIYGGYSQGKVADLERFCSENAWDRIKDPTLAKNEAYFRLYVNSVDTLALYQTDDQCEVVCEVKFMQQRVSISSPTSAVLVDPYPMESRIYLVMTREMNGKSSQGSLYVHQCPSCGAKASDNAVKECQYCGSTWGADQEWIVGEFLDAREYINFKRDRTSAMAKVSEFVGVTKTPREYSMKESALNNVIVILGADGKIVEAEEKFLNQLKKRFKVKHSEVEPLLSASLRGQLGLTFPTKEAERAKVIKLMKHAAMVDGVLQVQEKAILDSLK